MTDVDALCYLNKQVLFPFAMSSYLHEINRLVCCDVLVVHFQFPVICAKMNVWNPMKCSYLQGRSYS